MSAPSESPDCHLCGSRALDIIPEFHRYHRVTSDCKPWKPGGKLAVCSRCGCAQAVIDPDWREDARRIYAEYAIYHQSQGIEQSVFDQASSQAVSRSSLLLRRLAKEIPFGETGRLVDLGCGNGALLRAFAELRPRWAMAGVEVNDRYRAVVQAIPGVEALHTCPPSEVPGQFDAITLTHALEHIASPGEYLANLRPKLVPGGRLVVQVPDCRQNPFMYLVADHATHFTVDTLARLVQSAGYTISAAADDWVAKELTVVAVRASDDLSTSPMRSRGAELEEVNGGVEWLGSVVRASSELARGSGFGIFGTSIAATWLFSELEGRCEFFVDEDPNRAHRDFMGRPVYPPRSAPAGGRVFMTLPPILAGQVKSRLDRLGLPVSFIAPPPLLP